MIEVMIDAGVGLASRAELARYSHWGRAARRDFTATLSQPNATHSVHLGNSRCESTPNWGPAELIAAKSISLEKAAGRWASDNRLVCEGWLRFKLSFRDLMEMVAERGLSMAHTTIICCVHHYAPEFERRWDRFARPAGLSWRADETYV